MCSRVNLWRKKAFQSSIFVHHQPSYTSGISISSQPRSRVTPQVHWRTVTAHQEQCPHVDVKKCATMSIVLSLLTILDPIYHYMVKLKWRVNEFLITERVIRVKEVHMCLYLKDKVHLATRLSISYPFSKQPDSCFWSVSITHGHSNKAKSLLVVRSTFTFSMCSHFGYKSDVKKDLHSH